MGQGWKVLCAVITESDAFLKAFIFLMTLDQQESGLQARFREVFANEWAGGETLEARKKSEEIQERRIPSKDKVSGGDCKFKNKNDPESQHLIKL